MSDADVQSQAKSYWGLLWKDNKVSESITHMYKEKHKKGKVTRKKKILVLRSSSGRINEEQVLLFILMQSIPVASQGSESKYYIFYSVQENTEYRAAEKLNPLH